MSIPESVQLVLQAGASGESGELFLLDMGQPVKILDLACDMIRLCGFEPNVDIPITYCGIRPGEKMHEYLTTEDEDLQPATCDGLFVVNRPGYFKESDMTDMLLKMRGIISDGDTLEMRSMLEELVPGFCTDTIFAADITVVES
jgi:FlaA1/EpsC-like NDP-sugar epimerase